MLPGVFPAAGAELDTLAGWADVVGAIVAVLVVVVGLLAGWSRLQARALVARRRRWILPALRRAGWPVRRRRFGVTATELVRRRVRRGDPGVQEEIGWLSALVGGTATEHVRGHRIVVGVPLTFANNSAVPDYAQRLETIADAYDEYAVAVRRRWLLRSAAGPLIAEEYACARATAELLRRWSSFQPLPPSDDEDGLRGLSVTLPAATDGSGTARERQVTLVTWPHMTSTRSVAVFPTVAASYQPYRVVLGDRPDPRRIDGVHREFVRVDDPRGQAATDPLTFDGVLTRWHGDGFRIEVDRLTGRQQLHLCLSETSYFAFRATQVPEAADRSRTPARSRLLSLNLLAIDAGERVLLVRRSDYVVHPGEYAGTVSGNCELTSREGITADLDRDGFPDLLAALAREAHEELGLDLTRPEAHLGVLGVIAIDTEREIDTHLLVGTARLPVAADDYRLDRDAIDPIEGAWEIGDEALVVDLPAATGSAEAARRFVSWLRSSPELAPHAVGSLLLLIAARQQLRQRQHARAASAGRPADRLPWTTPELAEWLREPPPGDVPAADDFVRRRSL